MKETVLVTGSSRGIGRAVALKFASCGYRIVINCARSTDRLEEVKKEVEALGAECLAVQAEIRMTASVFLRKSSPASAMWMSS